MLYEVAAPWRATARCASSIIPVQVWVRMEAQRREATSARGWWVLGGGSTCGGWRAAAAAAASGAEGGSRDSGGCCAPRWRLPCRNLSGTIVAHGSGGG